MSIFALADLHLSGNPPVKPMDRFSPAWANHWEKIQTSWRITVNPDDTVLIAGDTSWAMKWKDAVIDLAAGVEPRLEFVVWPDQRERGGCRHQLVVGCRNHRLGAVFIGQNTARGGIFHVHAHLCVGYAGLAHQFIHQWL